MGIDKLRFVNPVNDLYVCSICTEVFEDPIQCPDEHIFCESCITQWLTSHATCPLDRAPLTQLTLCPISRNLRALFNELQLRCEFASDGCSAIVKLENLTHHNQSCGFRTVPHRDKKKIDELEKQVAELCAVIDDKNEEIANLTMANENLKVKLHESKTAAVKKFLTNCNQMEKTISEVTCKFRDLGASSEGSSTTRTPTGRTSSPNRRAGLCDQTWSFGDMAYRCRTCELDENMAICSPCFLRGNHHGHNYNVFYSENGGNCDCGDDNVMRAVGFCSRHALRD